LLATLQAAAANKDDKVAAAAAKAEIEKLVALKAEVGAAESGCAFSQKPTVYGFQHPKTGNSTVERRQAAGRQTGSRLRSIVACCGCRQQLRFPILKALLLTPF
jgi:predicted sugar kinase